MMTRLLTGFETEPTVAERIREEGVPGSIELDALPNRISHVIRPWARDRPAHPALADATTTWSYGELATIVADTAAILPALGLRPGDRLAVVSENSLALAALFLAAGELDAWTVVVNPRLSDREIDLI